MVTWAATGGARFADCLSHDSWIAARKDRPSVREVEVTGSGEIQHEFSMYYV